MAPSSHSRFNPTLAHATRSQEAPFASSAVNSKRRRGCTGRRSLSPSRWPARTDSPAGHYRCLYTADTAEAAIAETFGRFDIWDRDVIEAVPATPTVPNSRFALATFDVTNVRVCDLNDARTLLQEGLRPSDVVTRDLSVTQAWASRIHDAGSHGGVRWWCYDNPDWAVVALWDPTHVEIAEPPRFLTIVAGATAAGVAKRR